MQNFFYIFLEVLKREAKNIIIANIIVIVVINIVQCISAFSRIIPYISAPNGIPPREIIFTNEKTRDIYLFGVACCIKDWTGTEINILPALKRHKTDANKTK